MDAGLKRVKPDAQRKMLGKGLRRKILSLREER